MIHSNNTAKKCKKNIYFLSKSLHISTNNLARLFFHGYSIGWLREYVSKFSLFLISKEFYTLMFDIKKKTIKTQRQVNQIWVKSLLFLWFYINKILFVSQKYPIEQNLQKHLCASCIKSRITLYIGWIKCFSPSILKMKFLPRRSS